MELAVFLSACVALASLVFSLAGVWAFFKAEKVHISLQQLKSELATKEIQAQLKSIEDQLDVGIDLGELQ